MILLVHNSHIVQFCIRPVHKILGETSLAIYQKLKSPRNFITLSSEFPIMLVFRGDSIAVYAFKFVCVCTMHLNLHYLF